MSPAAWCWWWACAAAPEVEGPPTLSATLQPTSIELVADRPVRTVEVRDGARVVMRRRLLSPSALVSLSTRPPPGATWTIASDGAMLAVTAPDDPLTLWLEAPRGQGRQSVSDGGRVDVVALGDGRAALGLFAHEPMVVDVTWGGREQRVDLPFIGATATVEGPLVSGDLIVGERRIALSVERLTVDQARERVRVVGWSFPADSAGRVDLTRSADTLVFPPDLWRRVLARMGVGRPRDDQAPWAHQALTLVNDGDRAVDVLVEARVGGQSAEAFRPRLRDASGLDRVVEAVRLPPREPVTVALPLFVDAQALVGRSWTREITVTPLGSTAPLHRVEAPLHLRRGSAATWFGLLATGGSAALGWAMILMRGRRWLARQPTADLLTVASFAAMSTVLAGALQVVGHGVAALLGPFAPFLTAIADDALRACLLGALLTLLPRAGVLTLATVIGAVVRGLTLGSVHPADLLYVGTTALSLELCAFAAGLTRSAGWVDESPRWMWLRLSLGLGTANMLAMAAGLVVSAAFYRLYYAGWYVVALLALPGFAYVVVGCWVAVPLARSLRRVAS